MAPGEVTAPTAAPATDPAPGRAAERPAAASAARPLAQRADARMAAGAQGVAMSVVVTVVDGGAALVRCLEALAAQQGAPELEILVPYDESIGEVAELGGRFPQVRFLPCGRLQTARGLESYAGQHELLDRRRAVGLAAARGELIGMVEDRGAPRPDWARRMIELSAQGHAVVGGAVENAAADRLAWAVFFCDFARYQPPFAPGPREYVTDTNCCYRRSALEATRPLWAERYHETTVNWELRRAGETLYLSDGPVCEQLRRDLRLRRLLRERLDWGRLFAYTRAREGSLPARLALLALSPVLPAVLLVRQARQQLGKRRHLKRFIACAPVIALLLAAWSAGEMLGYATRKP